MFRVAVVYGAVAFAVLQAADLIFPRLLLPDWTVTLVLVLAALGFPVALVLAWAYDLGPGGYLYSACGRALAGDRAGAIRDTATAVNAFNEQQDKADDPYSCALAAVALILAGDPERAISQLERLVSTPMQYTAASLWTNPLFATQRTHPRYRALTKS